MGGLGFVRGGFEVICLKGRGAVIVFTFRLPRGGGKLGLDA